MYVIIYSILTAEYDTPLIWALECHLQVPHPSEEPFGEEAWRMSVKHVKTDQVAPEVNSFSSPQICSRTPVILYFSKWTTDTLLCSWEYAEGAKGFCIRQRFE